MKKIPKIIHQVWSGVDGPLPQHFKVLGDSWKEFNPDWEYMLWDNKKMNDLILEHYPQYWDVYNSFRYNIQRWDAIRYLILDKVGGVYVDFDTECLKPLDELLENRECCFSVEPDEHQQMYHTDIYFNNAFMASTPGHSFIRKVVEKTFDYNPDADDASNVLATTGPLMLVDLYENYKRKENVYLIPAKFTSPLTKSESLAILNGYESDSLEDKIKEAYLIHYFFNGWVSQL